MPYDSHSVNSGYIQRDVKLQQVTRVMIDSLGSNKLLVTLEIVP